MLKKRQTIIFPYLDKKAKSLAEATRLINFELNILMRDEMRNFKNRTLPKT